MLISNNLFRTLFRYCFCIFDITTVYPNQDTCHGKYFIQSTGYRSVQNIINKPEMSNCQRYNSDLFTVSHPKSDCRKSCSKNRQYNLNILPACNTDNYHNHQKNTNHRLEKFHLYLCQFTKINVLSNEMLSMQPPVMAPSINN